MEPELDDISHRLRRARRSVYGASTAILLFGWVGAWPDGLLFGLVKFENYNRERLLLALTALTFVASLFYVISWRIVRLTPRASRTTKELESARMFSKNMKDLTAHTASLPNDIKHELMVELFDSINKERPDLLEKFNENQIAALRDEQNHLQTIIESMERIYRITADGLPLMYAAASFITVSFEILLTASI